MVTTRYALVLFLLIVSNPTVPLELLGQVPYAAEEAEAGEAIYQRSCSVCHLPNLQGSFEAPQLAGASFQAIWSTRPTNELRTLIQNSMPPGQGGAPAGVRGRAAAEPRGAQGVHRRTRHARLLLARPLMSWPTPSPVFLRG